MSFADALLRTVLADPDDDAPRLIYADWLDEQGDCDRAEFIRLQCALAQMNPDDPRRPELHRRERELQRRHGRAWVGALPEFDSGRQFERGFVGSLVVVTEAFLRNANQIFETAPVRHVKLRGARWHMADLAAEPALERLARLDLSFNGIETAGAAAFFRSPHLGSLTELNWCWNPLGLDGLRALAHSPSLRRLQSLNLEKTGVGEAGLRWFVHAPVAAGLTKLILRNNALGSGAARALAAPGVTEHMQKLKVLDLAENNLDAATQALLKRQFGETVCRF